MQSSASIEEYRRSPSREALFHTETTFGLLSTTLATQTDDSEILAVKDLLKTFEDLKNKFELAKTDIQASYNRELEKQAIELTRRFTSQLNELQAKQQQKEEGLRRGYAAQLANKMSQIAGEHQRQQEELVAKMNEMHEEKIKALKEQIWKTIKEKYKYEDENRRLNHILNRQQTLLRRHSVVDPEIREVEDMGISMERLQILLRQREEEIRVLHAQIAEYEDKVSSINDSPPARNVLSTRPGRQQQNASEHELSHSERSAGSRAQPSNDALASMAKEPTPLQRSQYADASITMSSINSIQLPSIFENLPAHHETVSNAHGVKLPPMPDDPALQGYIVAAQTAYQTQINNLIDAHEADLAKIKIDYLRMNRAWQQNINTIRETATKLGAEDGLKRVLERQMHVLKYADVFFQKQVNSPQ